jgi:hypothetical protein
VPLRSLTGETFRFDPSASSLELDAVAVVPLDGAV